MYEEDIIYYILMLKGGEYTFRIVRYLILIDWRYEELYGSKLTNFKYTLMPHTLSIEGFNDLLSRLKFVEKITSNGQTGKMIYLKLKGRVKINIPTNIMQIIEQVIRETEGLDDFTLNSIVVNSIKYKRLLSKTCTY